MTYTPLQLIQSQSIDGAGLHFPGGTGPYRRISVVSGMASRFGGSTLWAGVYPSPQPPVKFGDVGLTDDDSRRDRILIRMLRTPPQPKIAAKPKGKAKPTKRTAGKGRVRLGKSRS